ncbi:TMEM165/GDT1 family protein [Roseateles sp. BYS180W]|uniref:GDT1 family protein n=1 Tax=Roseateles rivi TaxID=3299028 RepID=A0ABW7FQS0_9BURK
MEAFAIATGLVTLAEIGDKTQLLAFVLAARYRRPGLICLGILIATLANHAAAAALGTWVTAHLSANTLRWGLGLGFLAMAAWALVPDKLDDVQARSASTGWAVLVSTVVAFFLAEMGDKTQIATVALAARYNDFVAVVAGTTLGMMLANVPAVLLGDRLAHRIPTRWVHGVAAAVFAALGVATLLATPNWLPQ